MRARSCLGEDAARVGLMEGCEVEVEAGGFMAQPRQGGFPSKSMYSRYQEVRYKLSRAAPTAMAGGRETRLLRETDGACSTENKQVGRMTDTGASTANALGDCDVVGQNQPFRKKRGRGGG